MPSTLPEITPSSPPRPSGLAEARLGGKEAAELVSTLQTYCGLSIAPEKRPFIELRVSRRLRALGLDSYGDYLARLRGADGAQERQFLAESLVTHTTGFMRENAHFDWLQSAGLPTLAEAGIGRISDLVIWSAACSIGSELWSAGIICDRSSRGPLGRLRWRLIGSDLSRQALRRASSATYSEDEITGLPEALRRDYLLRSKDKERSLYRVIPEIRQRASFRQVNLMRPDNTADIEADIIFLRNVLIYFAPPEQEQVIQGLAARLRPGGYLLTGHSESLVHPPPGMVPILPSIYRKV